MDKEEWDYWQGYLKGLADAAKTVSELCVECQNDILDLREKKKEWLDVQD
jgi:hypothetical protein